MTCCGRYWSSSISGSTAVQTFEPIAAYVAPSTWRAESRLAAARHGNCGNIDEAAVQQVVVDGLIMLT